MARNKQLQEAIDAWVGGISSHPNLWCGEEDKALIRLASSSVVRKWEHDSEYKDWPIFE